MNARKEILLEQLEQLTYLAKTYDAEDLIKFIYHNVTRNLLPTQVFALKFGNLESHVVTLKVTVPQSQYGFRACGPFLYNYVKDTYTHTHRLKLLSKDKVILYSSMATTAVSFFLAICGISNNWHPLLCNVIGGVMIIGVIYTIYYGLIYESEVPLSLNTYTLDVPGDKLYHLYDEFKPAQIEDELSVKLAYSYYTSDNVDNLTRMMNEFNVSPGDYEFSLTTQEMRRLLGDKTHVKLGAGVQFFVDDQMIERFNEFLSHIEGNGDLALLNYNYTLYVAELIGNKIS